MQRVGSCADIAPGSVLDLYYNLQRRSAAVTQHMNNLPQVAFVDYACVPTLASHRDLDFSVVVPKITMILPVLTYFLPFHHLMGASSASCSLVFLTKEGRQWSCVLVADVVRTLLGRQLGDDEPLMEAGLDSLAASELVAGIKEATGVQLSPTATFDHPSIAALALHVQQGMSISQEPEASTAADLALIAENVQQILAGMLGGPVSASGQLMEVLTCPRDTQCVHNVF